MAMLPDTLPERPAAPGSSIPQRIDELASRDCSARLGAVIAMGKLEAGNLPQHAAVALAAA